MKSQEYETLIQTMKTVDYNVNRDTVIKKINCLGTAYREEPEAYFCFLRIVDSL